MQVRLNSSLTHFPPPPPRRWRWRWRGMQVGPNDATSDVWASVFFFFLTHLKLLMILFYIAPELLLVGLSPQTTFQCFIHPLQRLVVYPIRGKNWQFFLSIYMFFLLTNSTLLIGPHEPFLPPATTISLPSDSSVMTWHTKGLQRLY